MTESRVKAQFGIQGMVRFAVALLVTKLSCELVILALRLIRPESVEIPDDFYFMLTLLPMSALLWAWWRQLDHIVGRFLLCAIFMFISSLIAVFVVPLFYSEPERLVGVNTLSSILAARYKEFVSAVFGWLLIKELLFWGVILFLLTFSEFRAALRSRQKFVAN